MQSALVLSPCQNRIKEHGTLPGADPEDLAFVGEEQGILRPTALFELLVNVLSASGQQAAEDDARNQVVKNKMLQAWCISLGFRV